MAKKVRYGIIGIGKMGYVHAFKLGHGLDKHAVLTAVADISEERRALAAKHLKKVKIFDDAIALMDSGLVDAVIIAVPHYLHPEYAEAALSRGIHTIVEKPAGVYTSAVRHMNEFAETKPDTRFAIMYNQRTNPLYQKAKAIIDSGELGELKRINWIITDWYRPQAYYDQGGWRGTWCGEGGGTLINQCPHQLDLLQWLAGMPLAVTAIVNEGMHRDIAVENDVTAYLEYPNGASGIFITSTHDYPGTNRLEISGDGGQIVIDRNRFRYTRLNIKESEFNRTNTKFMPSIPHTVIKAKNSKSDIIRMFVTEQHMAIIKNFSRAILFGDRLIAPGEEGIRGLTISNAIHLSGWTGQRVALPINEEQYKAELDKRCALERAAAQTAPTAETVTPTAEVTTPTDTVITQADSVEDEA